MVGTVTTIRLSIFLGIVVLISSLHAPDPEDVSAKLKAIQNLKLLQSDQVSESRVKKEKQGRVERTNKYKYKGTDGVQPDGRSQQGTDGLQPGGRFQQHPDNSDHLDKLKIYNGQDAEENEFPFMARIKVERTFFRSGSLAWYGACGASILNSRVVMTAAHCLVYGDGIESLENPTNIKVSVEHSKGVMDYRVEGVIVNSGYDGFTFEHDIALIVLAEEITLGNGVEAIALPEETSDWLYESGREVKVAGWGGTEDGSATTLQKMDYLFSDERDCSYYWSHLQGGIRPGMVCTDRTRTSDSYAHIWSGDSGSPLFVMNTEGNFTQLAIVSWSSVDDEVFSYDVHTNVLYYKKWIEEEMSQLEYRFRSQVLYKYGSGYSHSITQISPFLYSWTHVSSSHNDSLVEATVILDGFDSNHFVMVYDGKDIQSDKMIAMVSGSERGVFVSSSQEGLTIVLQTNNVASTGSSFDFSCKLANKLDVQPTPGLQCPSGYWGCEDGLYCIPQQEVCDNDGMDGQCRDASDENEGCEEEEKEEEDPVGWKNVVAGSTRFAWNSNYQSVAIKTKNERGSWGYISVEFGYYDTWFDFEFGEVQMYMSIANCTNDFFGMNYPPNYSKKSSEYIITFNEDYVSVVGNGVVLWNFLYEGNFALDTCIKRLDGLKYDGLFAEFDTISRKYQIIDKPGNDFLEKDIFSNVTEDYTQFEEVQYVDIPRDHFISYDVMEYPVQVATNNGSLQYRSININFYKNDSLNLWIEIYFGKVPSYYVRGCTEFIVFFEIPSEELNSGERIWTFEFSPSQLVMRHNGREFGRVNAESSTVMSQCSSILGTRHSKIMFPKEWDTASDGFRVLCLDECMEIDSWVPIYNFTTELHWNMSSESLEIEGSFHRGGTQNTTIILFNEDYSSAQFLDTYYGETNVWVWISNCTESYMPLKYASEQRSDLNSYTFTFHDEYCSVVSNNDVIWNFYYSDGLPACKDAIFAVTKSITNAFIVINYLTNVQHRYRLLEQLSNDTHNENKKEPSYDDYSYYDEKQFEDLSNYEAHIRYNFSLHALQIKTHGDLPENLGTANMTINLLSSKGTNIGHIEIGFLSFFAYFYVHGCNENIQIFNKPDTDMNGTRTWTIHPSGNHMILRCNGNEIGSVEPWSDTVLDTCGAVFGGAVDAVHVVSPVHAEYRILCDGICEKEYDDEDYVESKFKILSPVREPHLGLLLTSIVGQEDWKTVCKIGIGRLEVSAICNKMGYKMGMLLEDTPEFQKTAKNVDLSYGLSDMSCGGNAYPLENCKYQKYASKSATPCMDNEYAAVSCSDEPFSLTIDRFDVALKKQNRKGKFIVYATASRFGSSIEDINSFAEMKVLYRHSASTYTEVVKMKNKSKNGYWSQTVALKGISISETGKCFVSIIQLKSLNRANFDLSQKCQVERSDVEYEIAEFLNNNVIFTE